MVSRVQDFRQTVEDPEPYLTDGLWGIPARPYIPSRSLTPNTERRLAIILDRDSQKWFQAGFRTIPDFL
jgi:type III restriction enzyme